MTNEYRFRLDGPKVTGRRQQKATCPQCGRRRCFVRYVDTQRDCCYLADDVGRCDHEQSCGYHYTPQQYFRDHPWQQPSPGPARHFAAPRPTPRLRPIFQPLAPNYVDAQHSPMSTFWQWMTTRCRQRLSLSAADLERVYEAHRIGSTRSSDVIFWQIDEDNRVHTGHIMQYGPDGHRLRYENWYHALLLREGRLPQDYVLQQCLFGQHLLPRHPESRVCLVESEKTALVLAAGHPEQLWLATCGCHGLTPEKVACLRGRRVTLFPDSGCYAKWCSVMADTEGIDYAVSGRLEAFAPNTDLADLLLGEAERPP